MIAFDPKAGLDDIINPGWEEPEIPSPEVRHVKLIADVMSAFSLYLLDPKGFNKEWFKGHFGLSNDGLTALLDHMETLRLKINSNN